MSQPSAENGANSHFASFLPRDLSMNNLYGTVPDSVAHLPRLRYLYAIAPYLNAEMSCQTISLTSPARLQQYPEQPHLRLSSLFCRRIFLFEALVRSDSDSYWR